MLKGKHQRALDSIVLNDVVTIQQTATQLIAAAGAPGNARPPPD